jgi:NosR/NirI family nitrous oxide reductase transcriptional regulator
MRKLLTILVLFATALPLWAEARFPPPEFSTGYTIPATDLPAGARLSWSGMVVLDVAMLVAFMVVATWLVHARRQRTGLAWLSLASVLYFGFYRGGCVCAIGGLQNVALALGSAEYSLPWAVGVYVALPLVWTLFYGRVFCAGVCPLGALQDLVLLKPLNVPVAVDRVLRLLPWVYLGLAFILAYTGTRWLICEYDPFVVVFRRYAGVGMLLVAGGFVLLSMWVGRPYCRWLCPYGALLSALGPLARKPVTVTPTTCIQCRLCEKSCPFGAIKLPAEKALNPTGSSRRVWWLLGGMIAVLVWAGLGWRGGLTLAQWHPTVQLAAQVEAQTPGALPKPGTAMAAFAALGEDRGLLLTAARQIQTRMQSATAVLGAALALILLAWWWRYQRGQPQADYLASSADCLACGRCYDYCPQTVEPGAQVVLLGTPSAPVALPPRHLAWQRSAMVTLTLTVILALLMLGVYLRGGLKSPLLTEQIANLQTQLLTAPNPETLRAEIRTLDVQLRQEYEWRVTFFTNAGGALLLGVTLTVILWKLGRRGQRDLPDLRLPRRDERPQWLRQTYWGIGAGGGLVSMGLVLLVVYQPVMRTDVAVATTAPAQYVPPDARIWTQQWPQFRGPDMNGVAAPGCWPGKFDAPVGHGVRWQAELPLGGDSSPVVWGNDVFLTGADEQTNVLWCFAADTGNLRWTHSWPGLTPPPKVLEPTIRAASTAVTDGRYVWATWATGEVVCVRVSGEKVWQKRLGVVDNAYGYASSLLLAGERLIIQYDQDAATSSALLALDPLTGRQLWRVPRTMGGSWSTPRLITQADGTPALLTCANPNVIAYAPATGRELWRLEVLSNDVSTTPVQAGNYLAVSNANAITAVFDLATATSGQPPKELWRSDSSLPDTVSPLTDGKLLLTFASEGKITCYQLADGKVLWTHDFGQHSYSNPVLAGKQVYWFTDAGEVHIFAMADTFREVGTWRLGEPVRAGPALVAGRMYVRGDKHLWCLKEGQAAPEAAP